MTEPTTRQARIETALAALRPALLEVINESHMHSVPKNSETHFKVVVVSQAFDGVGLVQRHRKVNELLAAELTSGLHALSIHALTPAQWEAGGHDLASPACRGGAGK